MLSIVKKGRISETQNQPFAKGDDDILVFILEKLEWIDRVPASTVCKTWLQEITKKPYRGEYPWLLSYNSNGSKLRFINEFTKRSYIIETRQNLSDFVLHASKSGRILMVSTSKIRDKKFFVFSPFSCKWMKLPTCNNTHADSTRHHYTFSSNPTLRDCVFFAVFGYFESQRIEIRTCKIGDNEWTRFEISLSFSYARVYVECVNRLLYVVFSCANVNVEGQPVLNSHVGTFDPESHEWKLIKNVKGFMESNGNKVKDPICQYWHLRLVVHNNEDLYLVRRTGDLNHPIRDLLKYDMENKQWMQQSSLGNRVLFSSRYGSGLLVEAVGKLSNLANKAFHSHYGSCYPYSFSGNKFEYQVLGDRKLWNSKFYQKAWILPPI